MASLISRSLLSGLIRPQNILGSSTITRRWASTSEIETETNEPSRQVYNPTPNPTYSCSRRLGPNGGILLSATAVQNLFNYPEFKHQKRPILPTNWRLVCLLIISLLSKKKHSDSMLLTLLQSFVFFSLIALDWFSNECVDLKITKAKSRRISFVLTEHICIFCLHLLNRDIAS
ncbi:hypothetical protein KEM48_001652 [Puccinia striiformis f. sp. tritici PST-130]|nr:hypothetical protein KEM48_001652 [Puccinia striiformis f. sp. tritici PST-130]